MPLTSRTNWKHEKTARMRTCKKRFCPFRLNRSHVNRSLTN